jgi:AraC family transcriptional regulator
MKLKAGQYYGTTSRTLSVDGFTLIESAYPPKGSIPAHAHELAHFCFVVEGRYRERIGRSDFERTPSTLVFYPADLGHAEEHSTGGRHLMVEVGSRPLARALECGARLNEPLTLSTKASMQLASRLYSEFGSGDALSPLALECIVNELLIEAARQNTRQGDRKPPRWLADAKEYLRASIVSPPALAELAAAVSVHPAHLARTFRRFESCSAGEYVRRVRIELARDRLANSATPIVEIAFELGFSDQAHFTRSFRSGTGFTPGQFRRLARAR